MLSISANTTYALTEWTFHKTNDGKHPDASEQQMLWLLNRARENPTREGLWLARSREFQIRYPSDYFRVNRRALISAFSRIRPKPPAAFDVRLFRAAREHTRSQIQRDVQDHIGQVSLIEKHGFAWDQIRYNVFSYANNSLNAHAGFNIDWGPGTASGMQQPPHHRLGLMSVDGDFTNVGISGLYESNPSTSVGRYVVSQNFCRARVDQPDHYNAYIVGTVWRDANHNDRYDPGEGVPDVRVTPALGDYFAITAKSGGYAIPITAHGRTRVGFSGAGIDSVSYDISVANVSVLVDHKLNANGNAANFNRTVGQSWIYLSQGSTDYRSFGNKWGNDRHEHGISARFGYSATDLLLTMRTHHIDRPREAEVFVNGQSLGYLEHRRKGKRAKYQRFVIPSSILSHTNRLEIRQRFNHEKWGVDSLRIVRATTANKGVLKPGLSDYGPYGWGRGGRFHRAVYKTTFSSSSRDFELEFEAFRVSDARDLEILINGRHHAWVAKDSTNKSYRKVHVAIPVSEQIEGQNSIEFRSHKSVEWGVRDIQLKGLSSPTIPLRRRVLDKRRYGWRFPRAEHRTFVRRSFDSLGTDLVLSLRTRLDDDDDAVSVYVNGEALGRISAKQSKRLHRFSIPMELQQPGRNIVEFRRRLRSPKMWYVSDTQLKASTSPAVLLEVDAANPRLGRRFGWKWGSDRHREVLRAEFQYYQKPADILFSSNAFNIRYSGQAAVYFNGTRLGFLSAAQNRLNAGDNLVLPAALLRQGKNTIEIRNREIGAEWGLTNVMLERVDGPRFELKIGLTDYSRFALVGGDRKAPDVVTADFYATGEDLDLEVIGFDIDSSERVEVYLNDKRIGQLSQSRNNGHSTGEHFFVPASLQRSGRNSIQFRRRNPHSRWGVTRLSLKPIG